MHLSDSDSVRSVKSLDVVRATPAKHHFLFGLLEEA